MAAPQYSLNNEERIARIPLIHFGGCRRITALKIVYFTGHTYLILSSGNIVEGASHIKICIYEPWRKKMKNKKFWKVDRKFNSTSTFFFRSSPSPKNKIIRAPGIKQTLFVENENSSFLTNLTNSYTRTGKFFERSSLTSKLCRTKTGWG